MTAPTLDRERLRELFDLRSSYNAYTGGTYEDDPYPIWHRLRAEGPVLPGILHELTGSTEPLFFHGLPYPDRPHFTVFDYDSCMTAYRNPEVFASSPEPDRSRQRSTGPDQQHAFDGRRAAQAVPRTCPTVVPAGERQVVDRELDL